MKDKHWKRGHDFRLVFALEHGGKVESYMTEALPWPEVIVMRNHCPDRAQVQIVADCASSRRRERQVKPIELPYTMACGGLCVLELWRLPVPYVAKPVGVDVFGKPLRKRRSFVRGALVEALHGAFIAAGSLGLFILVDLARRWLSR